MLNQSDLVNSLMSNGEMVCDRIHTELAEISEAEESE